MDVGVVGNRRSAAGDLMLPVKLLEYVSLGIPAVVPRLRTIEHYFTDDMVAYYEPERRRVAGRRHSIGCTREPDDASAAGRAGASASSRTTAGSGRAPNW